MQQKFHVSCFMAGGGGGLWDIQIFLRKGV